MPRKLDQKTAKVPRALVWQSLIQVRFFQHAPFRGRQHGRSPPSPSPRKTDYPPCCYMAQARLPELRRMPDRVTGSGSRVAFIRETLPTAPRKSQRNQSGRGLRQGQRSHPACSIHLHLTNLPPSGQGAALFGRPDYRLTFAALFTHRSRRIRERTPVRTRTTST